MWWAAHAGDEETLAAGLLAVGEREFAAAVALPADASRLTELIKLSKRLRLPRYTA